MLDQPLPLQNHVAAFSHPDYQVHDFNRQVRPLGPGTADLMTIRQTILIDIVRNRETWLCGIL